MNSFFLFLLILTPLLSSCTNKNTPDTYSLIRDGAIMKDVRIHIATFDNKSEKLSFNKDNCMSSADFFNLEVKRHGTFDVKYWCEKGNFKE